MMKKMRRFLAFALAIMMFMSNTVTASATSSVSGNTIVDETTNEGDTVETTTSSSGEEESSSTVVEEPSSEPSGEGSDVTPSEPSGEGDDGTSGENTTESTTETVTEETTEEETTVEETTEEETTEELPEAPLLKTVLPDTTQNAGEYVGMRMGNYDENIYYFTSIKDAMAYLNENASAGAGYSLTIYEACEVSGDDLVSTSGAEITVYFGDTITVTPDENNNTTARINVNMQGSASQAASTLQISNGVSLQLLQGSERYTFTNMTIAFAENNDDTLMIGSESDVKSWNGAIVNFNDVTLTNVENMTIYNGFQHYGTYSENGVSIGNLTVDMIELGNYGASVDFWGSTPYLLTVDNLDLDGNMMIDNLKVNDSITATDDSSIGVYGEASLNNLTTTSVDKAGWKFNVRLIDKYDISYDAYEAYDSTEKPQPVSYASLNLSGMLKPAQALNISKTGAFTNADGSSSIREVAFNLRDIYSAGVATVTLSEAEDAGIANASLLNPYNYNIWAWQDGKIWYESNRISSWNFDYVKVENEENTYQLLAQETPSEIQLYVDPDGDDSDNSRYDFASLEDVKEFITEINPTAFGYYIWINADNLEVSGDVFDYSSVLRDVNVRLQGHTLDVKSDATIVVDKLEGWTYNNGQVLDGTSSDIKMSTPGTTLTILPKTGYYTFPSIDCKAINFCPYEETESTPGSTLIIGNANEMVNGSCFVDMTFERPVSEMHLYGWVSMDGMSNVKAKNLHVHNINDGSGPAANIPAAEVENLYLQDGDVGFCSGTVTDTLYINAGRSVRVASSWALTIQNMVITADENDRYASAVLELERNAELHPDDNPENPNFNGVKELDEPNSITIKGTVTHDGMPKPILVRKNYYYYYSTEDGLTSSNSGYAEFENGETVITVNEDVPTDVFSIEGGEYRFLQREDNILKAAGAVLRVGYGENEDRIEFLYTSLEEAAKKMAADFESVEGTYDFTLLNDTKLTANVTLPDFVTTVYFDTESAGWYDEANDKWNNYDNTRYQKFLDLNGKTLTINGALMLNGGVRMYSSVSTRAKLILNTYWNDALCINESCVVLVEGVDEETHAYIPIEEPAMVLENIAVSAPNKYVKLYDLNVLEADDAEQDDYWNGLDITLDAFGLIVEGGNWTFADNNATYIDVATLSVYGSNKDDESRPESEPVVEAAYLSCANITVEDAYFEVSGDLDANKLTVTEAMEFIINGNVNVYNLTATNTMIHVNGSLNANNDFAATNTNIYVNGDLYVENNATLNDSDLCERKHVFIGNKLSMTNNSFVEVWSDFHAKEISAATSKILVAPEGDGSLYADKITVSKAYAGDAMGDYTLQNNGQILVREKLSMTAGTLENFGLIEADEVSVKDLNNSRTDRGCGQVLCNTFTNTGKMYLSEDSQILINESGTLNNVNVGDRFGSSGFALVGKSEDATVTFKGTFTRNDEDQQLLGFVTNEYVGKIGDTYIDGEGKTKYNWDWITLSNDNGTPNNWDDDYDADYVIPLEPNKVLFETSIKAFPVEAVRVLPWTVMADDVRIDNSNNAVYQSGTELKITGEYIHVCSINADGNGETWLKAFSNWNDAVAYINTLNNPSAKYAININSDLDVKGALTLPTKAAELIIRSGKGYEEDVYKDGEQQFDGEGNPIKQWISEPVILSYQGNITQTSNLTFEGIKLDSYIVSKGKESAYKSTIDTRGKLLALANVEVLARVYNEDGSIDHIPSSLYAVKGTATTQFNIIDGTNLVVDTKISGLNEIYIANGASLEVTGGISVNNLVTVNWPEWAEDNKDEEGNIPVIPVKIHGANSVLEVKTRLNMFSPTEVYCAGSMKIKDVYSNCFGNVLKTDAENKITISGRVLSDNMGEAWNKQLVVAVRDDADYIVGYRWPADDEVVKEVDGEGNVTGCHWPSEEELESGTKVKVPEEDRAEVMPFAVRISNGGSKLATAALVSPIWFVADSGDTRCDFDFTHKDGNTIVGGTNEKTSVVLSVLFDYDQDGAYDAEQEMNRFNSLQDAFTEIDKIATPDMSYKITLNGVDETNPNYATYGPDFGDVSINAKTKKVSDYTFPKQAKEVVIVGNGEMKSINYNQNLSLKSNVTFENVILSAKNNGTVALGNFTLKVVESIFSDNENGKVITHSISGGGVSKGSELVIEDETVRFAKVTGVNYVTLVGSHAELLVDGELTIGDLVTTAGGRVTVLGKFGVNNIEARNEPAVLGIAPKVTVNKKSGAITAVAPNMTISGEIKGNVEFALGDGTYSGALVPGIDVVDAYLATGNGISFVKAPKANPKNVTLNGWNSEKYYLYKKAGVFVVKPEAPQVALTYDVDGEATTVEYETFADAVTEINNLKTMRNYEIKFLANASNGTPATLTSVEKPVTLSMPKAGCADMITLTADDEVSVHYIGNITMNSNVVLENIDFVQVVTVSKKNYSVQDAMGLFEKYYNPANVTVSGAYTLDTIGEVRFDTPVILNGSGKATLKLDAADSIYASEYAYLDYPDYLEEVMENYNVYVEGSIKNFANVKVDAAMVNLVEYTTGTFAKSGFKGAELNVTNLDIVNDGYVILGNTEADSTIASATVKNVSMTASGLDVLGNAAFTNVTLSGYVVEEEDGNGGTEFVEYTPAICVTGQKFNIAGTLTSTSGGYLQTELNAKNQSVLNISGKVVLEDAEDVITVGVNVPEGDGCYLGGSYTVDDTTVTISNKLLTAKYADISAFRAASWCVDGEEEYDPEEGSGYILRKSGNDILVYYADEVEVALYTMDKNEEGEVTGRSLYNYYTSFNEAVAAIEALKNPSARYMIEVLQDVGKVDGDNVTYEKVNLPTKAEFVSILSQNGSAICYSNDLVLGCDTAFAGVDLKPQPVKGVRKGINIKGYELMLDNILSDQIGKITGDNKTANVQICTDSRVYIAGNMTGVIDLKLYNSNVSTGASAMPEVFVAGNMAVENLIYENAVDNNAVGLTTINATIKNIKGVVDSQVIHNLFYTDLNITGDIEIGVVTSTIALQHNLERTPATYAGAKLNLGAAGKLASVKKASLANVRFYDPAGEITNAQWSGGVVYAVEDNNNAVAVYAKDGTKLADCVDLTQASAYINAVANKIAGYEIRVPNNIEDTSVTDKNAVSTITLPAKDKMNDLVVDGADGVNPVITFAGNIAANGVVTLQDIQLKNTADFSITHKKNSDRKEWYGIVKGNGQLDLNNVTVVATESLVKGKPVVMGNLKSIAGEKNATLLNIANVNTKIVRLETAPEIIGFNVTGGITNVVEMSLTNTALMTNAGSNVGTLKLASGGSWVGLGATTIDTVDNSNQDVNSYLGTYLSAKNVPQMTINGMVGTAESGKKPVVMKLYDFATKTELTEDKYTENTPLVIAKKEAAQQFIAAPYKNESGWTFKDGIQARKDAKNYVYNGDISDMEVLLKSEADGVETFTYVKTYAEAISIINSIGNNKADYILYLRNTTNEELGIVGNTGVIMTASTNGIAAYGALALPAANKANSLTITSENLNDKVALIYTGVMAPKCDLKFEHVMLSEGVFKTVNRQKVMYVSNYVTPVLGTAKVTFGEGAITLSASDVAADMIVSDDLPLYGLSVQEKYELVFNSVSTGKGGTLDIADNEAYVIGNATITTLQASADSTLSVGGKATVTNAVMDNGSTMNLNCKNAITITDIKGAGELAVKTAYTNKAWGKAVTQLTIAGELAAETGLTVSQYVKGSPEMGEGTEYKLVDGNYIWDMFYDSDGKPLAYQKLITAPKLQITDNVDYVTAANEFVDFNLFKYEGAVYATTMKPVVEVVGGADEAAHMDAPAYRGEFFTWEQAVKEIDKLNHGNDRYGVGGWYYTIILREDIGTYGEPIKTLTLPTKAAKVTIAGEEDYFYDENDQIMVDEQQNPIINYDDVEGIMMTGTSVVMRSDLDIKVPVVALKKTGMNFYDTVYTLNTGNFDLVMDNVPNGADFADMGWHQPMLKLTGAANGTATITPGYDDNDPGDTNYTGMIQQISKVGTVTLKVNENAKYEQNLIEKTKHSYYDIADGILNVGDLILDPGAMVSSSKSDVSVKNLTMGDTVEPYPVAPEAEVDLPVKDGLAYPYNEMRSSVTAKNVTVSDTLTMASSYIKAGLTTGNDGKVTLNKVVVKDNHNTIEGKQDRNGRSQINIRGAVSMDGNCVIADCPAIAIGLYYNNSAWKFVSLTDNMALLTAPKAASSWFSPCYGGGDYPNMGPYLDGYGTYKSGNNVLYGRLDNMEVRVLVGGDYGTASTMEFATFEEAVKAIDSMAEVKQTYIIELLKDVEIGNENQNKKFKALTLPAKASEVTVRGNGHTLTFTGNVTLRCNTTFFDVNLIPVKMVKNNIMPAEVNLAVGNFKLNWQWANVFDGSRTEEGELIWSEEFGFANITGSAKGELIIAEDSFLKANNITGLNVIRFKGNGVDYLEYEGNRCYGQILTDGNVTIKELHYADKAAGILRVRGNLTTNVIYVTGENDAQIWRADNKIMKVNGVTLTENGIKTNESVVYKDVEYVNNPEFRVAVKTVAANASTVAPGTKIITGKYLDVNDWSLYSFDTSNETNYLCNAYMSGTDIYLGQ